MAQCAQKGLISVLPFFVKQPKGYLQGSLVLRLIANKFSYLVLYVDNSNLWSVSYWIKLAAAASGGPEHSWNLTSENNNYSGPEAKLT